MKGFFETQAGLLEYARWGAGDTGGLPILLLHEGLGSVELWKSFPQLLADATGRETIAWSRAGHGHSGGSGIGHDMDYMHREAECMPLIHDALGLGRAHWLGHSDGGSIALIAASRFPSLVDTLILEAPHVHVEKLTASSIARMAADFDRSDMGERMKKYHAEPVAMFRRWTGVWMRTAFLDWNIEEILPFITAPALLIQGIDDQYGTMDQLDRIARVLPDTKRLELEACGHSPHHEQTEAVILGIRDFLREKA